MQPYMEILTCESLRTETIIIGYKGGMSFTSLTDQQSPVSLEVEEMKFKRMVRGNILHSSDWLCKSYYISCIF